MAKKPHYTIMYNTGRVENLWYVLPEDMDNAAWLVWVRLLHGQITHLEDIISPDGTSVLGEYFTLLALV